MKKVLIPCFVMFLSCLYPAKAQGQELISLLDGKVTFELLKRDDVIYTKAWKGSWRGKIRLFTGVDDEEAFRTHELSAFSPALADILERNNRRVSRQELLDLLKTNLPFALLYNAEDSYLERSYSAIKNTNNEIIGETFFMITPVQYHWPCGFDYNILLVVEDSIIDIGLSLVDTFREIPKALPEYFITKEDGETYWKSKEAITGFYERMQADIGSMPGQIQTLYEAYNLIMETLAIKP